MLPKCHPGFNPIERVWGEWAQRRLVAVTANISIRLRFKFEQKFSGRAYLEPATTHPFVAEVHIRAQKTFRSHRGIPPSECTDGKRAKPWAPRKLRRKQVKTGHRLFID